MKTRTATFVGIGLFVALLLAAIVSFYASGRPDGLNKVASDTGFNADERDHDLAESPFAGYSTSGVNNERLSGGVAGIVGVFATLVVAGGMFYVVKRRTSTP
jgi:hypothetical protein